MPLPSNPDQQKMGIYNALDAANTFAISEELDGVIRGDPDLKWVYDFTIDLHEPLMYMMYRGIKVDRARLALAKTEIEQKIKEVSENIEKFFGPSFNPGSHQQVAAYFYVKLGIPPYTKRNDNGESVVTTDDKALQRLARGTAARKGRPEANLIQEYRRLTKLKSTYLDITLDADGRFRYQLKPRGTRFSRISSGQTIFGTGMNLQNLPEEFKGFLVSDPGFLFIELDKAKAEWVAVAYLAEEENMIRVIEADTDPHIHTARQILLSMGTEIDAATLKLEDKVIGHTTNPDEIHHLRNGIPALRDAQQRNEWLPRTMSCRQMGKKSNHGLNYRESAPRFALENEIQENEAKIIVNGYGAVYPGIDKWHQAIERQLKANRTIFDLFGRKYRFLGKYNDELWKAAISYGPQSTIGHLVNRGIIQIYRDTTPAMRELDLLGQVHDSIIFQYPVDKLPWMAHAILRCKEALEPTLKAHGREFVIRTDMKIGYNWRDMLEVNLSTNPQILTNNLEQGLQQLGIQETT